MERSALVRAELSSFGRRMNSETDKCAEMRGEEISAW